MPHLVRMTVGEWYKLRRRWLPWILLAVLVLITQGFLWGYYAAYHLPPPASDAYLDYFALPASIESGISDLFTSRFAVLIIMVLTASSLGTEYGWGTLRTALTKGAGRWQVIAAKLALAVVLSGAGLLAMALAVMLSSIAGVAISGTIEAPVLGGYSGWLSALSMLVKAVYALVPYAVLGIFFVALTQSTAQGITLAVVFFVVEGLVLPPLLGLSDYLQFLQPVLLIQNVDAWLEPSTSIGGPQAFIAILVYAAVLTTATLWIFMRRDVSGPRGE